MFTVEKILRTAFDAMILMNVCSAGKVTFWRMASAKNARLTAKFVTIKMEATALNVL